MHGRYVCLHGAQWRDGDGALATMWSEPNDHLIITCECAHARRMTNEHGD